MNQPRPQFVGALLLWLALGLGGCAGTAPEPEQGPEDRLTVGKVQGEIKVGITWMPTRTLLFGCSGGREKRGSDSALSYPYATNIATCVGQIKLQ